MSDFNAFRIVKTDDGFERKITRLQSSELSEGEVLLGVHFSSLNYKDGLSATGHPGVTRNFPHTPGIDAAGTVLESSVDQWKVGDQAIVTGYDLGMETDGGFAGGIRVPAKWLIASQPSLGMRGSMVLGTAGLTAALCVDKLYSAGLEQGEVLVTGATGGVGSIAVRLLSHLGFSVVAVSNKTEQAEMLGKLGASEVMTREALRKNADRPLLAERWAGVVDTVGGDLLFNAVKGLRYGASAAICGLVNSPEIPATVLPFILRHVNLLGVDSVMLPLNEKERIWQKLASEWKFDYPEEWVTELSLDQLSSTIDRILKGQMVGRGLLCLSPEDRPAS